MNKGKLLKHKKINKSGGPNKKNHSSQGYFVKTDNRNGDKKINAHYIRPGKERKNIAVSNVKDGELIRINKYLSSGQRWSRRQADDLIDNGRVKVNGKIATLGQKVDPASDQVEVDDKLVNKTTAHELIYFAYYKPVGEICSTAEDAKDKVYERFRKYGRLFTIGRLDVASEGLIVLTNDGESVNKLLKAKNSVEKTYEVWTKPKVTPNQVKQLKNGVELDDGYVTLPANVKTSVSGQLLITIIEGKNRQVRRMCEAIGLEVVKLRRLSFGKLTLRQFNLNPGDYKIIPVGIFKRLFGLSRK